MSDRLIAADREENLVNRIVYPHPSQTLKKRQTKISLMSQMKQVTERLQRAHQLLVAGAVAAHQNLVLGTVLAVHLERMIQSRADEPSPDEGTEDGEPEEQEDNSGHNDEESEKQNPADSGPEDDSDDADSNNAEQEGSQENHEEDQEDQEHESDNEDAEDDDEDREEDEDDDEDDDEEDECLIAESALLHSPNPEPLEDVDEGDVCSVRLREEAICIVDSLGRTIGAIAEPWVGTLKECIEQGRQYRARVLNIDGGKCEVRVTNKCLVNQDVNLTATNTAVRDQLHPELSLSVEKRPKK